MINFLKSHIEKLILAVALVGLMAVAGWLAFRVGQLKDTSNPVVPKGRTLKAIDTGILDQVVDRTTRPPRWISGRRTFTPPLSVWTMDKSSGLYRLVPSDQIEEGPRGDMDVAWLKKYSLPNVSGIGERDSDGDEFTNREERDYKTDPTDGKSYPLASDYITYVGPDPRKFFLRFQGYSKSPDGSYSFQINVNDFDHTYFVRLGEQVASGTRKENYFVDKFEFDEGVEEFDPTTNSKRKNEKSRLYIHRGGDPTPITLTYKQVATDLFPRAKIRNEFDRNLRGGGERSVSKDDEFQMRGKTYKVVDIKESEAIIAETLTQQEFVVKPPKGGE